LEAGCVVRHRKNIENYNVFVRFAYKKYLLQQVENRVIISVFARLCLKNTANTVVDFATSGTNIANTANTEAPKTSVFPALCALRVSKERENTIYLTIFRTHQNATKRCVVGWLQVAVCK